jgi:uncharacterized iron-regulated membrane protein
MTVSRNAVSQFLSTPRKTALRRWAFQIHFYTGIAMAVFLLLIGLSGSSIVFHDELERSFRRAPSGTRVDTGNFTRLQTIVESLESAHAGNKVGSMKDLDRRDGVVEVRMKGSAKEDADLTAFWDRHSGEMTNAAPAASRFLTLLVDFHKNLAMGKEGLAVNGIVAIGFVMVVFTGLIAWWPGLVNWKRGFTLNWKLSWKRINYDLHNSVGIVSITFLMPMAVTAVCLAAKDIPKLMAFGPDKGTASQEPAPSAGPVLQAFGRALKLHFPVDVNRLGGKGLVRLDEVEIAGRPSRGAQSIAFP